MTVSVRFMLDAEASPGLLPRVLQPFAKRDLVPDRMWSHRTGDMMHVEVAMEAMPEQEVHLVEGNLRQIVGVRHVQQIRPAAVRRAA
jgi:acetolactate synthase regulatory subunit